MFPTLENNSMAWVHWRSLARPLLIIIIFTMLLISINPFALKKIFVLVAALLGLSSAICLADPLFMTTRFTLRDHQSRGASPAVLSAAGQSEQLSFVTAKDIISDSTINWVACRSE